MRGRNISLEQGNLRELDMRVVEPGYTKVHHVNYTHSQVLAYTCFTVVLVRHLPSVGHRNNCPIER